MSELFSKSMDRIAFVVAAELIADYTEPMMIVKRGSWRVTEYNLETCELMRGLGHRVYFWKDGKWKE